LRVEGPDDVRARNELRTRVRAYFLEEATEVLTDGVGADIELSGYVFVCATEGD
jgi:hypothetical protein